MPLTPEQGSSTSGNLEGLANVLHRDVPDLVARFDHDLRIIYANRAAERVVRAKSGGLTGRCIAAIGLPSGIAARIESCVRSVFREHAPAEFEFECSFARKVRVFHARAEPVRKHDAHDGVLWMARDRTEYDRTRRSCEAMRSKLVTLEARARRHNQVAVRLARRELEQDADFPAMLRDIVEATAETLGVERASLWRFSDDRGMICCVDMFHAGAREHTSGQVLRASEYPAYFAALERERAIAAADARGASQTRELTESYLTPLGITSMLDAPVRTGRQMWGILCCEHVGPIRDWTPDETAFSASMADLTAISLEAEERLHAGKALRASEERFRTIFECAPLGAFLMDGDGSLMLVNETGATLLGSERERLRGRSYLEFLSPPDAAVFAGAVDTLRDQAAGCERLEHQVIPEQGDPIWAAATVAWIADSVSTARRVLVLLENVTHRRSAWEALARSEQRFREIAENINEVFWMARPDGSILYLSPAFERIWGVSRDAVLADPRAAWTAIAEEDRDAAAALWNAEPRTSPRTGEYRVHPSPGEIRWVQTRVFPVRRPDGDLEHLVGVTEDVTERKALEERLVHDATHDPLTGLPNRALFMTRLQRAFERAQNASGHAFALLLIDLDDFKLVNDSLGHYVGDALLHACAGHFLQCARPGDTVARLGGDEFVFLLEGPCQLDEALAMAQRLEDRLRAPFRVEHHEVFVRSGVGIALADGDTATPDDLLRNADTALYQAKRTGRARIAVFDHEMHARNLARLRLEGELHRALEREEFLLDYQPIVRLENNQVVGFEALLRWRHPTRGVLSPGEFLTVAEETGLIPAIGAWVLDQACRDLARWTRVAAGAPLSISVNVSGRQIGHDLSLVEQLDRSIANAGADAGKLRLEITEGVLLENAEHVLQLLARIRERGIQLQIDDFGTGYSSLSYLHRLPVGTLKVDRSFVSGPAGGTEIVRAIATLADSLGLDVIAEGIETAEQLAAVRSASCGFGQGYYFSYPLDPRKAEALIGRTLSP